MVGKGVTKKKRNKKKRKIFIILKRRLKAREILSQFQSKSNYEDNEINGPNLLVNFFNVKKKFTVLGEDKIILKNFNYTMKGEKIGIIGKNGSGNLHF